MGVCSGLWYPLPLPSSSPPPAPEAPPKDWGEQGQTASAGAYPAGPEGKDKVEPGGREGLREPRFHGTPERGFRLPVGENRYKTLPQIRTRPSIYGQGLPSQLGSTGSRDAGGSEDSPRWMDRTLLLEVGGWARQPLGRPITYLMGRWPQDGFEG